MLKVGNKNGSISLDFGFSLPEATTENFGNSVTEGKRADEFMWNTTLEQKADNSWKPGETSTRPQSVNSPSAAKIQKPDGGSEHLTFGKAPFGRQPALTNDPKYQPAARPYRQGSAFALIGFVLLFSALNPTITNTTANSTHYPDIAISKAPQIEVEFDRLAPQVRRSFEKKVRLSPPMDSGVFSSGRPLAGSHMFEFVEIKRQVGYGYFGPATRVAQSKVGILGDEIPIVKPRVSSLKNLPTVLEAAGISVVNSVQREASPTRLIQSQRFNRVAFFQVLVPNLNTR